MDAFPYLSALLPDEVYHLVLVPLLQLLSRFAAHSHLSGLTPHALSSLFAPLLFDIPTSLPAMASHAAFVRAASATEHFLLAHIRSTALGKGRLGLSDLPTRLKEWVTGYPDMVATDAELAHGGPRRGARVVRCDRASRTVRAYSRDLITQCEHWAGDVPGRWKAWESVIWKDRRDKTGRPKFSIAWRRRMSVKEAVYFAESESAPSDQVGMVSDGRAKPPGETVERSKSKDAEHDEARWSSLAGKEWSIFEEGGFDASQFASEEKQDIQRRLQFDLSESAKTVSWSRLSNHSRTDETS